MSLLVTGTVGIDTVITPEGRADEVLGGSAVYFALGAVPFTEVRLVAVVGEDFHDDLMSDIQSPKINLAGLEVRKGSKTFRWVGQYHENMNDRDSLETQLNVVGEEPPAIPDAFLDSKVVFLANTHPAIQMGMREKVPNADLVVCDTMDLWINNERDALIKTFGVVDGVIINDSEAMLLTGKKNAIAAGHAILELGPKFAVVKKGEHGAVLFDEDGIMAVPAFPAEKVVDPTGAGDSFAGGMLGYLAGQGTYDTKTLRKAIVRGTLVASFTIEGFSVDPLTGLDMEQFELRLKEYTQMLRVE